MTIKDVFTSMFLFFRKLFCVHKFINEKKMMGLIKNPEHRIAGSVVVGTRMVGTFFIVSQCSKCGKIKRVEAPNGQEEAFQMMIKNPPQGGSGVSVKRTK